jgi:hypothetical protein
MPENAFEGMGRVGFRKYLRTQYEQYGKPKYQDIIDQALEHDPDVKLSTSTISDTFKGKTFPKLPTTKALGLGIGGPELAEDFEQAWRAAWKNHRQETHHLSMEAARRAQEKDSIRAEKAAAGSGFPNWLPGFIRRRGLYDLLAMLLAIAAVIYTLIREPLF